MSVLLSPHRYDAIQYAVLLSIRSDGKPLFARGAADADTTSVSANSTDKDTTISRFTKTPPFCEKLRY